MSQGCSVVYASWRVPSGLPRSPLFMVERLRSLPLPVLEREDLCGAWQSPQCCSLAQLFPLGGEERSALSFRGGVGCAPGWFWNLQGQSSNGVTSIEGAGDGGSSLNWCSSTGIPEASEKSGRGCGSTPRNKDGAHCSFSGSGLWFPGQRHLSGKLGECSRLLTLGVFFSQSMGALEEATGEGKGTFLL